MKKIMKKAFALLLVLSMVVALVPQHAFVTKAAGEASDNLALTATVTSSNGVATGTLKDGDRSSGIWASSTAGTTITDYYQFNWATPVTVDQLTMVVTKARNQAPTTWHVEVSKDGETGWTKVASIANVKWTELGDVKETKELSVSLGDIKGIRVYIEDANRTWNGYAIQEFEIYNKYNGNLVPTATVTSSNGVATGNLKDGDRSSGIWAASTAGTAITDYYQFNWENPITANQLTMVVTKGRNQAPTAWRVEVSKDGETGWTPVASIANVKWTENGDVKEITDLEIGFQREIKGIRVYIEDANRTWSGYAIQEMEVACVIPEKPENGNYAPSAEITSDNELSAFDLGKLQDGIRETGFWKTVSSSNIDESYTLKWNYPITIDHVDLSVIKGNKAAPKAWQIDVKKVGENDWTQVASVSNVKWQYSSEDYSNETNSLEFPLQEDVVEVRVFIDEAYTEWGQYTLFEIEVYKDVLTVEERYFTDKEPVTDYAYSFAVIGDTQVVLWRDVQNNTNKLSKIYDWILENKETKNIEYVFGLGDITDMSDTREWERAKTEISKLDGKIPYLLNRGNHDGNGIYFNDNYFNEYLGTAEYYEQFENGGFYQEEDISNSWTTFSVGSIDYLVLALDFGVPDDVIEWASGIISEHPNHNVIVTTHAYLYSNGTPSDETDIGATLPSHINSDFNNGDDIWEKLISKHENIVLVLSGHESSDNIVMTQVEGDHGNTVTQMLIDPQYVDQTEDVAGMVAMLYFSEDGKKVQVEYYSTTREKYFLADNQFSFEIDVVGRPEPVNGNYASLAEISSDNGLNATNLAKLNDGNRETGFWKSVSSSDINEAYTLEWSYPISINQVNLSVLQGNKAAPKAWRIDVKKTGETEWTQVASISNVKWQYSSEGGSYETKSLAFELQKNVVGVRVYIDEAYTEWGQYDLYEIEVYNNSNTTEYALDTFHAAVPFTYPTQEGKVFAGWYKDAEFKNPVGLYTKTGNAYAKFVDKNVLSFYYQLPLATDKTSETTAIRLVTSVDSEDYETVGFQLEYTLSGQKYAKKYTTDKVYSTINGIGADGEVITYQPSEFSNASRYMMAMKLNGVPKEVYDITLTITPQWLTLDGTTVNGITRDIVLFPTTE